MWEPIVIHDPGHPLLVPAARLISDHLREVLGPDEPPYPVDTLVWRLTPTAGRQWGRLVVVADGDDVLGVGQQGIAWEGRPSSFLRYATVAPQARRRGIGRALIEAAAALAVDEGRNRLDWHAPAQSVQATTLSLALGAKPQDVLEQNRVATSALDRALLESWVEEAPSAGDYELVAWEGPTPEQHLEAFVSLETVMDSAPGNNPDDAIPWTRDHTRRTEIRDLARGPWWRVCARHVPTSALVGFTDVHFPHAQPWFADQGDTAVQPAHRGHRLGRRLKGVNALRILDERPDIDFIETWNAETNAPMLAINRLMGFETVGRWQTWSLSL